MNCRDFETHITDLARDQMMDAAARKASLAHAEACGACAARLRDERALSAGLKRLAECSGTQQTPDYVESRLVAAFRERKPARRSLRWVIGAAAAAVIFFIFAFAALRFDDPPQQADKEAPPSKVQPKDDIEDVPKAVSVPPVQVAENKPAPRPSRRQKKSAGAVADDTRAEIATEFFTLVHRENLAQMDGGQLVRVELPRSALVEFGLPMNMERVDERIKADVLVGNDGLARAIRFVYE